MEWRKQHRKAGIILLFLSSLWEFLFSKVHLLKQEQEQTQCCCSEEKSELFLQSTSECCFNLRDVINRHWTNVVFVKSGYFYCNRWSVSLSRCLSLSLQQTCTAKTDVSVFISYFSFPIKQKCFHLAKSSEYHITVYNCLSELKSHILCYFPEDTFVRFILSICLISSVNLFFLCSSVPSSFFWSGFLFHCIHKTQSLEQHQTERSTEAQ